MKRPALLLALAAASVLLAAGLAAAQEPSPGPFASPSPDPFASPVLDDTLDGGLMEDDLLAASPSPDPSQDWPMLEDPQGVDPSASPSPSPGPFDSPSPEPFPGMATPTDASPSPAIDPLAAPAVPSPSPFPAATPSPAPVPSPSPPPPPPPSPPPPPVGFPVNLVLLVDGAPSPMPAALVATVAGTLGALTPGQVWTFSEQQAAVLGKLPKATKAAVTQPATAAAGAPAPAVSDLRVTVDPLPTSNLGGRRRLRQALPATTTTTPAATTAPGELAKPAKDQCWSVKHFLAPDEPTCLAFCDAQVASGALAAALLEPKFYDNDGNLCCRCAGKAATPTAPAPGAAAPIERAASLPPATPTITPATPTPTAAATPAAAPATATATPAAATKPAPAPAAAPDPDPNTFGVYYFASTTVLNKTAEEAVVKVLQAAATSGQLLSSLEATTGADVRTVDIMFLGSGPYKFTPLPERYTRPVATAPSPVAGVEVEASTGGNKGLLLGAILGGVCAAVIVAAIVATVLIRRKRAKKADSKGVVKRWESERKQAEDFRLKQAEERRQASLKSLERHLPKSSRSKKGSAAAAAAAAAPRAPNLPNLDRLREALGLQPRDHLAAAAARLDAAEAAEAAASASMPLPTADYNASSSGGPSPARSVTSETHTAGSEVPLTGGNTVVVRAPAPAAAGPSWATRDPGAPAPKGGLFSGLFKK